MSRLDPGIIGAMVWFGGWLLLLAVGAWRDRGVLFGGLSGFWAWTAWRRSRDEAASAAKWEAARIEAELRRVGKPRGTMLMSRRFGPGGRRGLWFRSVGAWPRVLDAVGRRGMC